MERHEEPHRGAVFRDQVLQHEEFDIPPEVREQLEKVAVPRQRLIKRAAPAEIVPADTLQREIEPVGDLPLHPRLPFMIRLPSIRFPGKTIMPPIV